MTVTGGKHERRVARWRSGIHVCVIQQQLHNLLVSFSGRSLNGPSIGIGHPRGLLPSRIRMAYVTLRHSITQRISRLPPRTPRIESKAEKAIANHVHDLVNRTKDSVLLCSSFLVDEKFLSHLSSAFVRLLAFMMFLETPGFGNGGRLTFFDNVFRLPEFVVWRIFRRRVIDGPFWDRRLISRPTSSTMVCDLFAQHRAEASRQSVRFPLNVRPICAYGQIGLQA